MAGERVRPGLDHHLQGRPGQPGEYAPAPDVWGFGGIGGKGTARRVLRRFYTLQAKKGGNRQLDK